MTACFSPIDNCAVQVNRLDCDGLVLSGATDVVVSCSLVDITATPIKGEERNQRDPNGQGGYCAERNIPAEIVGYDIEITLCSRIDVELMELLGIFDPVLDATGAIVGYKSMGCSTTECLCNPPEEGCTDPGVAIHIWHIAWQGEERHPDFPFVIEAFPKIKFDPTETTTTRNSEFNTHTIKGRAYCNDEYGQGPGSIYPDPTGLGTFRSEWLTETGPPNSCNCELCGYAETGAAIGN